MKTWFPDDDLKGDCRFLFSASTFNFFFINRSIFLDWFFLKKKKKMHYWLIKNLQSETFYFSTVIKITHQQRVFFFLSMLYWILLFSFFTWPISQNRLILHVSERWKKTKKIRQYDCEDGLKVYFTFFWSPFNN